MAVLILRRFRPEPPLLLRRFGPDGRLSALAERAEGAAVPVAIAPPQAACGAIVLTATAGEAIGGHRAVKIDAGGAVLLASAATLDPGASVGVSTHAAAAGNALTVQLAGAIEESGWAWALGAVFLGEGGALTQVPPTAGVLVRIGTAFGSTGVLVAPQLLARL